jgi:hypothetical protein
MQSFTFVMIVKRNTNDSHLSLAFVFKYLIQVIIEHSSQTWLIKQTII